MIFFCGFVRGIMIFLYSYFILDVFFTCKICPARVEFAAAVGVHVNIIPRVKFYIDFMAWKRKRTYQSNIFISIGAGINQLPLIREAKQLGLIIVGVDQSVNAAGISECDIRIHESIENYSEIYKKLRELLLQGDIKGVLSKSFGAAIKTSSFLANKLNIPLISHKRVDDFIDKKKMKSVLHKNHIKSPSHHIFTPSGKDKRMSYPFIIKPNKGHAKTNVRLIKDADEFGNYLENIGSLNGSLLIEKYIEGDEIIAIGIVHKGRFHLVDITDKVVKPPHFVDLMHISPSRYYHLREKISDIGQRIAESFEIKTSPMLMELMVAPDGEIYVIETAPEFGGEFLSDVLIPARTGYNLIREAINAVMDKNFTPPKKKTGRGAVVVKYITGQSGTLISFKPLRNSKRSGLIFSRIFKDIGSAVSEPVTNHDRLGVIITKGETREDAIARAEAAESAMEIRIRK